MFLSINPAVYIETWRRFTITVSYKVKSSYVHCQVGCIFTSTSHIYDNKVIHFFHVYALVIGFPEGGGGPRADVGTLLIVHFKVLVFPYPGGIFFLQSPQYLAKPSTQLDLKMHFRTLFWFLEQLSNTRTIEL